MSGNVPVGVALSELNVMSVLIVELPSARIVFGLAEARRSIQGLKSAVPVTALQPALPGPALQPHQLFSAVTIPSTLLNPATLLFTIRFRPRLATPWLWTSTPVPPPMIVLWVTLTG